MRGGASVEVLTSNQGFGGAIPLTSTHLKSYPQPLIDYDI